jgi:hypothetical protein
MYWLFLLEAAKRALPLLKARLLPDWTQSATKLQKAREEKVK